MCVYVCVLLHHTYRIGIMQLQKVGKETHLDQSQLISNSTQLPDLNQQKVRPHDIFNEYQKNIVNNNNYNSDNKNRNPVANRKNNKDEINKQLEQQEKLRLSAIVQQSDVTLAHHIDNLSHHNHRTRCYNLNDNKNRSRSKTVSDAQLMGREDKQFTTNANACITQADVCSGDVLKNTLDCIASSKKSRNHKTTSNVLDNAGITNGNICINLQPRTVTMRSLSRFRTRTAVISNSNEQTASNVLPPSHSQSTNSSKLSVLSNIKPLVKRGKRTLSSAQIEREKSDEKNTKLLRKHAASRSLSPLIISSSSDARKQKTKLAIHESNVRRAQRKSLSVESQVQHINSSNKVNKTGNEIIQPNIYVAHRLRKR